MCAVSALSLARATDREKLAVVRGVTEEKRSGKGGFRFGITRKFAFILALQLVGVLVILLTFLRYEKQSERSAQELNLAVQVRSLVADLNSWTHMIAIGQDEDRPGLSRRLRAADTMIGLMVRGGTFRGREICAPEGVALLAAADLARVWSDFSPHYLAITQSEAKSPAFVAAYEFVVTTSTALSAASERTMVASREESSRLVRDMLRIIYLGAGFSLFLLLLGVFLTRKFIVRPIRSLVGSAKAVARGDLALRVSVGSRDELATLAECFNEMSTQIERSLSDLRSQERRNQLVLSSVPTGLLLLGHDSSVIEANRALYEILGTERALVRGRGIEALLPSSKLLERIEALGKQSEGEQGGDCDAYLEPLQVEITRTSGEMRVLQVRIVSTQRGASGASDDAPTLIVVEDRTEEEALRAQARSLEARFSEVVEHATDCVIIMGPDGLIQFFNRAAEATFGHARKEVLGKPMTLLMPEQHRKAHTDGARRHFETGESKILGMATSLTALRKDGTVFPIDITLSSLVLDGTRVVTGIGRDMSERQQLTARMMQVDRMVAVGTLVAGVGHEINNPLTYVMGNLAFAMEAVRRELVPGPEAREQLQTVSEALAEAQQGAGRIRDIVSDLRTFSRGDKDERESIDLLKVLASSLSMCSNEIRHRARLIVNLDDCEAVLGNASRLGQVFLNLLVNAAQSIGDGAAESNEIRVSSKIDGAQVIVEIGDTGCGISAEVRDRIFDPFFTTKPVGQGTGLGLSICQQIIEEHEGRLDVESEVGVGTLVRVSLPRACEPSIGVQRRRARTSRPGNRANVLVVDDELRICKLLKRMLEPTHHVDYVVKSSEAIAKLDAGVDYDVILCDLMMPEISGIEFYEFLLGKHPDLAARMIFVTGGAFTPQAQEFIENTARPCLYKPFSSSQVTSAVRKLLASAPQSLPLPGGRAFE